MDLHVGDPTNNHILMLFFFFFFFLPPVDHIGGCSTPVILLINEEVRL